MKAIQLITTSIIILILCSCMSPEERKIKDYLQNRVKPSGENISSVEIISSDSVLSLAMMDIMYNECLRKQYNINDDYCDALFELSSYHYHALVARDNVLEGKKWKKFDGHELDWRRIDKVKVKSDGKERDDIEVIYDVDGHIMMVGREYDQDLSLWRYKIESLPGCAGR